MSQSTLAISYFFHLIATVVWIGGLVILVLLVWPTGRFQRAGDPNYEGMLQFDHQWSQVMLLKHIAIGGMVISGLLLQLGVVPALERASLLAERGKGDMAEWERLRRREVRLTWLNVGLGLLVLGFTAWATAL